MKTYQNILWFLSLILLTNGVLAIREYGFSITGWILLGIGVYYLVWERFYMKKRK